MLFYEKVDIERQTSENESTIKVQSMNGNEMEEKVSCRLDLKENGENKMTIKNDILRLRMTY
jgi:hypothetical protein